MAPCGDTAEVNGRQYLDKGSRCCIDQTLRMDAEMEIQHAFFERYVRIARVNDHVRGFISANLVLRVQRLLVVAILIASLIWTGCKYKVYLDARDREEPTHATTVWIDSIGSAVSGSIQLTIGWDNYSGTYTASPSDYGMSLLKQHSPKKGELVKSSSDWYGRAFLQAPDGKTLQCEYKGSHSGGGYGVCLSSEGELYDLTILR